MESITNYFEAKIRYIKAEAKTDVKIDTESKKKKVTESYLINAVNYTDAETTLIKELPYEELTILSIKKSNIVELITNNDNTEGKYYKIKIAILEYDDKGKEKETPLYCMVIANSAKQAITYLNNFNKNTIADSKIKTVTETDIVELLNN